MNKTLIFCTLILLISCTSQQKDSKNSINDNIVRNEIIAENDTLRKPNHYHYLADISPREFAELIMKDSVSPSDNFSTFRVIDSLNAKSLENRKFYFKVFLNIMKKSDGALAEVVGLTAYDFVEKHTKEFFELSQTITKKQFESWANTIGEEIYISSSGNPIKDAEKYYKKLQENCSREQKNDVEKFCKTISQVIIDESN